MLTESDVPWYRRAWAWLKAYWQLPFILLLLVLGAVLLRRRGGEFSNLSLLIEDELRSSRQVADTEIEQIRRETAAKIEAVEERHAETLAGLEEKHREEYNRVRRQGPRAVAKWLNDFDKTMR